MPAPWARGGITRPVTQAIFGLNVAVFLGMVLAGSSVLDPTTQQLIHWGANSGRLTLSGEWWRLVTSMFLHVGIVHIALNMWCLWSLGSLAESLYGPWMFGAVWNGSADTPDKQRRN
jgi:rhomboid protease GluP